MQKCNEFNEGIIKLAIVEYIRMIHGFCDVEMNKDSDSSKSGSYGWDSGSISYQILFHSVCIAL